MSGFGGPGLSGTSLTQVADPIQQLVKGQNRLVAAVDALTAALVAVSVAGPVLSVAGRTGVVALTENDTPLPITTTYTGSGAIAVTDSLALVNSVGAAVMTLASGTIDGHQLTVKRYGVGAVSITANIDGTGATVVNLNGVGAKEAAVLVWQAGLATWLQL